MRSTLGLYGMAACAALILAGSAPLAAAPVADQASPVIRHDIAVATVDPAAVQQPNLRTNVPNKHLALVPTNPALRKNKLYIFIPGTHSSELLEQDLVYTGLRHGYHALAVAYPNYAAVAQLCKGSPDDDCTAKVREEILTGADLSPLVKIAPKDAFETRLKTLLAYLSKTFPDEGWGQYLTGSEIDWSRISVAGHSQGAGHAAYLAKMHAMARVAIISGVADTTAKGGMAPWLSRPNVTPTANIYGFTHTADPIVTIKLALASWNAMGLAAFGAPQSVDGAAAPYGGSHMLTTSTNTMANQHLAMADDDKLPRTGKMVSYDPVWAFIALP